jgi:hypothetical protein
MFSLILKIQAFLEQLRKKKALWFTSLTVAASLGIIGTMYYLTSMTSRSAKSMYEATHSSYMYDLDGNLEDTNKKLQIASNLLLANQGFIASLANKNDAAGLSSQLKKVSVELTGIDKSEIAIDLYTQNGVRVASSLDNAKLGQVVEYKGIQKAIATNTVVTGVEYEDGRVYIRVINPMGQGAYLELKKPIDYLVDTYNNDEKIFQVLLDKDLLDMKKLQEYKSVKVGKSYISIQGKASDIFLEKIADLDFEKLLANRYILTDSYFVAARPILDANGAKVGILLVGEDIMKDKSLPKMTKSISNGLTTAALGLVVALLILMV